jgi:hypothetical protein
MLKNLFIYSFKYVAVVLALVAFSACNRTEFTEEDAYDLENRRAWEQQKRDSVAALSELNNIKDLETFRAALDQLMRDNAGGRVFYTVSVVPGGSTAFTMGRLEDVQGVAGVRVSAAQFGGAFVQEVVTNESGLAVFELYSGEVTVSINAPDHTNVNYVSHLTPNGGVANGSISYVGNVVPVFDDPSSPNADIADIAAITGKAVAELDLTNTTEENVPNGTPITAHIDVENETFLNRYIRDVNQSGLDDTNNGINGQSQTNRSGQIQRIAYQQASQRAVANNGDYSMLVAATASGLPIRIFASDFAFNRVWFTGFFLNDDRIDNSDQVDGSGLATSTRFLYTMNTSLNADDRNGRPREAQTGGIVVGDVDLAEYTALTARFVEREAVVNVAYIAGDRVLTERIGGKNYLVVNPAGATAAARVDIVAADGGKYLLAPSVTFSAPQTAGGEAATGVAEMVNTADFGDGVANTTAANTGGDFSARVHRIEVTSWGSGYTAAPSVTITRQRPGVSGTGSIQAPTSAVTYVRVIDGGYRFTNPIMNNPSADLPAGDAAQASNSTGSWTGLAPVPNVPVVDPPINGAQLVVKFAFDTQNPAGGFPNNGFSAGNYGTETGANTGSVQAITVTGSGTNWTPALLAQLNAQPFRWSESEALLQAADGESIFDTDGTSLIFNNAHPAFVAGGVSDTDMNLDPVALPNGFTSGRGYVFVPTASITGDQGTFTIRATLRATVDGLGRVTRLQIIDQGSYTAAPSTNASVAFIVANPPSLNAQFFLGGSGIDNYVIAGNGQGNFRNPRNTTHQDGGAGAADVNPVNNSYVAMFSAPADATGTRAIGIPVFGNNATGGGTTSSATSQLVTGIEIIDQGVNYAGGEAISFDIVEAFEVDGVNFIPASHPHNAKVAASLTPAILRFTIVDGGLGYAVRPEVYLYGANKSAEDLDGINVSIRSAFATISANSAGSFTVGASFDVTVPQSPFNPAAPLITPADIAAEAANVSTSVAAVQGRYNARLRARHFLFATTAPAYLLTQTAQGGIGGIQTTPGGVPNLMTVVRNETVGIRDADGFGGFLGYVVPNSGAGQFRGFPIGVQNLLGLQIQGFEAYARINPYDAREVVSIDIVNPGSGLFVFPGNNEGSVSQSNIVGGVSDGEPFRFIGGRGQFETFSGMSYVRDIHYGTGIELE